MIKTLLVFKAPRKLSEMVRAFPEKDDTQYTYFRMPNDLSLLEGQSFDRIMYVPNKNVFPHKLLDKLLVKDLKQQNK